jgi:hypothetical protein
VTLLEKNDFGRFSAFFGAIVEIIGNLIIPLHRARRVVLGTSLKHLEHVPKRIPVGITNEKTDLGRFSTFLGTIVGSIGNPMIPLDRARQIFLGTRFEHLEYIGS